MSEFKFKKVPDIVDAKIISEKTHGATSRERDHGGPGNQADRPALAKTLADATQTNIDTTTTMSENIPAPTIKKGNNDEALDTILGEDTAETPNPIVLQRDPETNPEEAGGKLAISEKNQAYLYNKDKELSRRGDEIRNKISRGLTVSEEERKQYNKEVQEYHRDVSDYIDGITNTSPLAGKNGDFQEGAPPKIIKKSSGSETTTEDGQGSSPENDNSWQGSAVAEFESKGGKILDAKLEERDVPTLTEVVEGDATTPTESQHEFALTPEAKLNLTPEQQALVEKFENNVKQSEEALEDREVAAKIPKGKLEQVSLWYNKLPLKAKLGLSAGMIATGFVVGSAAAPALITAGVLMRTLGASGMIYALRDRFEKSAREKNGGEITGKDAFLSATSAIAISAFVSVALPNIVREYAFNPIVEKVGAVFDFYHHDPIKPAIVDVAPPVPKLEFIATACPGDSRWSLVARALADGPFKNEFAKMGYSQQTYVIDALKDRLTLGMTEDVANTLNVGDKIDFKDIFGDKKFMEEAFSGAKGLTTAQIESINNYTPDASEVGETAQSPEATSGQDVQKNIINNATTHQDTLIKTILTEEGKYVPIMEHHVPVETVLTVSTHGDELISTAHIEGRDVPIVEHHVPTETHAVTQGAIVENVAHSNPSVEYKGVKGTFSYAPDGKINKFVMGGSVTGSKAEELFNDGYRRLVMDRAIAVHTDVQLRLDSVGMDAREIEAKQGLVYFLEQSGQGSSQEANFLKTDINNTINRLEGAYGDIFKNTNIPSEHALTSQTANLENVVSQVEIQQADIYVRDKVNDVFGIKFLGFTLENGMKNADWLNFANRTVDEVYSAGPHPTEAGNYQAEARSTGMGNNQAISKMQNLIYEEAKRVGVKWEKGETVDHFLHRVALIKTTIVDVPHGSTIQSPEITPNTKLGFDPDITPGGN